MGLKTGTSFADLAQHIGLLKQDCYSKFCVNFIIHNSTAEKLETD